MSYVHATVTGAVHELHLGKNLKIIKSSDGIAIKTSLKTAMQPSTEFYSSNNALNEQSKSVSK